MLKILFIIFIVIPVSIWIGTLIANLVSIILMIVAVAVGGLGHKIIKGKKDDKWHPPDYLALVQILIINGFILTVYLTVFGGVLNSSLLLNIGSVLRSFFGVLLVIDLFTLIALATIHGPFDVIGDD